MAIPSTLQTTHHVGNTVEDIKMGMRAEDFVHVAFMFENLYSDPIAAVVREYSTNAWDSHVFAGQTRPIEITLPNESRLEFSVQDFGVGMSLDTLRAVYSMYGASDKRETNAVAGQLGMGSKSGLSYAAGFTVTAVKDHEKVSAFVTKDEHGLGVIKILAPPVATDEPNGVKITIPVERYDVRRFHDAADMLFQFSEKDTVLVDGKAPEVPAWRATALSLDAWDHTMLINPQAGGLYSSYVIMGNVPYPVRDAQIDNGRSSKRFVARLNISDVDFAPSREDVRYTPHTNETLSALHAYVGETYKRAIKNHLATAQTRWEETMLKTLWMDRRMSLSSTAERPIWVFDPNGYSVKAKSHFNYSLSAVASPNLMVVTGYPSKTLSPPARERLTDFAQDKGLTNPTFLVLPDSIGAGALDGRPNTFTWNQIVGATEVTTKAKAKVKRDKYETVYNIYNAAGMTAAELAEVTGKVLYLYPNEGANYGSLDATVVCLYSTAQLPRVKRSVPNIEHYPVEAARKIKAAEKAVTDHDRKIMTARTLPDTLKNLDPSKVTDPELAAQIRLAKSDETPTMAAARTFGITIKATQNLTPVYNKRYPLLNSGGYYGNSFNGPGQRDDFILYLNAKHAQRQAAKAQAAQATAKVAS